MNEPVKAEGSAVEAEGVPSLMESAAVLGAMDAVAVSAGAGEEAGGEAGAAESGAEEAGAEAGDDGGTDEDAKPEADKPGKFTPEQQRIFDARLGKEVSKRKLAEEKAAKLEADLTAAQGAADATAAEVARVIQVMPEYLKQGEPEVLKRDAEMSAFEDWAAEHQDGYEAPDGSKSYTAAQIRRRLVDVQREHNRIVRQADDIRERARKEMQMDLQEGRKARAAQAAAAAALKGRQPVKAGAQVEPKPAGTGRGAEKPNPDAVFEKHGKNKNAAAEALGMM